jgi:hypothetical protein
MKRSFALLTLCSSVAWAAPVSVLDQVAEPSAPFHQERFVLGYEVYLGNGNQAAAYRVAERAVRERPQDVDWRRRLAQVAQWLDRPEVALANWLVVARKSGDAAAWREVGRLAPALADNDALLAWRQHEVKRLPGDERAIQALVAAYEGVGQPEAALSFLNGLTQTRLVLGITADLAERSGQDEQAITALLAYDRRFGPDEGRIVRAAGLHLQQGRLVRAETVLKQAEARMPASAGRYWQMRADVAQLAGDQASALQAYRQLEASGKARPDDVLSQAALLGQRDPLAAAQRYVQAWQKDHQPSSAVAALQQWSRVKAWVPADAFLLGLSTEDRARLELHAAFLEQRANLHLVRGRTTEAGRDLAAALALEPRNGWLQQSWISWMVAYGDDAALRRLLQERHHQAARQPGWWPLWASGWNRLDAPEQALPWLQQHYQRQPDDLSALALADTLRAVQQPEPARALEQAVWSRRLGSVPASPELQQEYSDALFRLRLAQLPVDERRQALRTLIQREQGQDGRVRDHVRDLVLAEAWAGEASDTLPPYVGEVLPASQPLPHWSRLGTALLLDDEAALADLLEAPERLPANDRVVAAIRLGRTAQATQLAAQGAEQRPFDDVSHQYWQERIWRDGDRVNIAVRHEDFSSLTRNVLALEVQQGLTAHLGLHLGHERADLSSDPLQVRLPEARQAWSVAGVYWQGENLRAEGALTYFEGIDITEGVRGELQWSRHPLQLTLEAGLRQPATDSATLRVGGYQDYVQLGANWQLTPRTGVQAQFSHALLAAQGGGDLGEADTLMLAVRHQLDRDWSLSARIVTLDSVAETVLPPQLIPVLPVAAAADPALFVPSPYTLAGLGLAWGESAESGYQRRWRSFAAAGLSHDDITGLGYEARVGLLGPVTGRDRLRVFATGSDGAQANAQPTFILNLDYQYFY